MTQKPYYDHSIVNHQSYVVPGVVDAAVMASQAERRRDREGEVTIVHAHPYEDAADDGPITEWPCNLKCRIFQPGFKTRSIYAVPETTEEN